MTTETNKAPKYFFWKRMHSLSGVWLVLFLIEHLLTNSQAALFIGDDGSGFVRSVNFIKNLPYLPVIEISLLGVPILVHLAWGIQYLRTAEFNSFKTDGTKPALPEFRRNRAFTWQRITSWILVFTLIGHIVHMRFISYPAEASKDNKEVYMVRVTSDTGLYTLAERLGVQLFDQEKIHTYKEELLQEGIKPKEESAWKDFVSSLNPAEQGSREERLMAQQSHEKIEYYEALKERSIKEDELIAVAPSFGTAELLMVRETFKWPLMIAIYTVFVLAAVYHGFNGLWTSMICWGVTLSPRSQDLMRSLAIVLMVVIGFLGLAAIWGTYFINLKS